MRARLAEYLTRLPAHASVLAGDPVAGTAPTGSSFTLQLQSAGVVPRFLALVIIHIIESCLVIAGWVFVGSGALSGRLDTGWLVAWALCLASVVPVRFASRWLEGVIAIGVGGLLKQRLLAGAMAIDADVARRRGVGELLGEVLETEAIDRLATSGGVETVLAALEVLIAMVVLGWGASAVVEIALLAMWCAIAVVWVTRNTRRRLAWTTCRLDLTHRLVERMIAHRTRVAQQPPREWHDEEDVEHERYLDESASLDRSTACLEAALPRVYLIAALAALAASLLSGTGTITQQAITLGAVLFAAAGFQRLTFGLVQGAAAWIAWRRVRPIFDAAAQPVLEGCGVPCPSNAPKVFQAEDVTFTHPGRAEPAVKGCTLVVERGDRVLIEGESGSGKSTFASLVGGVRTPSAGVILAGGLDRSTLGETAWRRRVAVAPQYHDNHILSAPIGFNLLLGRPHPRTSQDLEEAGEVCEGLGLGPLLERMPAGLDQMVGETGWQLSHGERSRVFLARALLQRAELVVVDESLAALDPENLRQCLEYVFRRAGTLMLIAHP